MTEEQKVKDLPQAEQETILKEAQELKIQGILPELLAEDLKQKIADAKAVENTLNKDAAIESTEEVVSPYKNYTYKELQAEAKAKGLKYTGVSQAKLIEALMANDVCPQPKESVTAKAVKKDGEIKFDGICHVCLQKVFNGICSGCGRTI